MPDNSGAGIMVATNAKPGEDLSFKIYGHAGNFRQRASRQQAALMSGGGGGAAWAADSPRGVTVVRVEDWARRLTPMILCTITAP